MTKYLSYHCRYPLFGGSRGGFPEWHTDQGGQGGMMSTSWRKHALARAHAGARALERVQSSLLCGCCNTTHLALVARLDDLLTPPSPSLPASSPAPHVQHRPCDTGIWAFRHWRNPPVGHAGLCQAVAPVAAELLWRYAGPSRLQNLVYRKMAICIVGMAIRGAYELVDIARSQYREYVFGPQTSNGPVRIEFSVKPCSKNLHPGIRSLERSAKCAPHPGNSRSSRPFISSARI